MARSLWLGETIFYRALVEELVDDEWSSVAAYGPYATKNQCQDRGRGFAQEEKHTVSTRRKRVQKQAVVSDGMDPLSGRIEWVDV